MNTTPIKDLTSLSDAELAKKFLKKRTGNKTVDDLIAEVYATSKKKLANKEYAFSKVAGLDDREMSFLSSAINQKYDILSRDSSKYELNIEAFITLYEEMLAANWNQFDQERVERDKQDLKTGKEQLVTTQINAEILNVIIKLVTSINLTQINNNKFTL